MLNLAPIFEDAITAMRDHSNLLEVKPLPATVFLLQCDVINHYRYALTHYFNLTLNEHYLQNSSIGTPYEKWAKFANEDFEMFSFCTHNLIRYTSRLIHETWCPALRNAERYSERTRLSNGYTVPICDINYKHTSIGVRIGADETLAVTPFAKSASYEGTVRVISGGEGTSRWFHTTVDAEGEEIEREISKDHFIELTRTLREREYEIRDRSMLTALQSQGLEEVEKLVELNRQFGDLCKQYEATNSAFTPFDHLHQSWCM
jgi:hypothetical protein